MASPPADYSMGPPISGESTPAARGRGRGRGSRGGASGEIRSRGKGSRGGSTGERGASRGGTGSRGGRGAKAVGSGGPGSRGAGGPGSRGGRGSRGARGSSASKRSTSASTAPVRERSTSTQVAHRAGSDDEEIAGPSTAQIANVEDDADDGEDEYEDAEVEESWEDEGWARQKALNDAKKANLSALLNAMSSDQYNRHEVYLRQSINKNVVRRIITNAIGGQTIPQELASLAGGMAKVFVGELVERARALRAEQDPQDTGPLHPAYYHEAYRQYKAEREQPGMYPQGGGGPGLGKRRRMF